MGSDEHRYANGMTTSGLNTLTEQIIACAFKVLNALGPGFLEKVYENALAHELRKSGHHVKQQDPLQVIYDGVVVGNYEPDLLVDEIVIVDQSHSRAS